MLYKFDTAYYKLCFQSIRGMGQGMGLFGTGVGRICAVVAASTAAEMRKQVRSAIKVTRTVELRLDWLHNDLERSRFQYGEWHFGHCFGSDFKLRRNHS